MAKVTSSRSRTRQEINLRDVYGRRPTTAEQDAFIDSAIDLMITRSQGGQDVNGEAFVEYSQKYADLKGVSRGDVDMTLFFDMLDNIEGNKSRDKVELKIEGEESIKAYAHMKGYPGHPTIKNGPVREFFGLTDQDIESIAESVREISPAQGASEDDLIDEFLSSITIEAGENGAG